MKRLIFPLFMGLISVGLFCFLLLVVVPKYQNAYQDGDSRGKALGETTGIAIGSFKGITTGINEGAEKGKEEGLLAKDSKIALQNEINELGKLEVLVANVEIPDFHKYGDKYAALYLFRGKAIFSVDMSKIVISTDDLGTYHIIVPLPEANVSIDPLETERIVEKQRQFFNGNTEDGFDAFLNTFNTTQSLSQEKISNYDFLRNQAKTYVIDQILNLANSMSIDQKIIQISFLDGE